MTTPHITDDELQQTDTSTFLHHNRQQRLDGTVHIKRIYRHARGNRRRACNGFPHAARLTAAGTRELQPV